MLAFCQFGRADTGAKMVDHSEENATMSLREIRRGIMLPKVVNLQSRKGQCAQSNGLICCACGLTVPTAAMLEGDSEPNCLAPAI